jgi:hypothetical protein
MMKPLSILLFLNLEKLQLVSLHQGSRKPLQMIALQIPRMCDRYRGYNSLRYTGLILNKTNWSSYGICSHSCPAIRGGINGDLYLSGTPKWKLPGFLIILGPK